jgi:UDP-N-acetylmuramyl tripeptide synthase
MADVAIGTRYVRLHNDDAGSRPQAEMQLVSDRAEAIALASSLADAGDVVVIVGSQVAAPAQFAELIVDEAELTRELLYQRHQPLLRIAA